MQTKLATFCAALALFLMAATAVSPAAVAAEDEDSWNFLGLDLRGSLGEGRHSRYVPPLNNPIFNETPYITTEARPFYFYHKLPSDFITDGGHVHLIALQLRLALTERLGFIATKDGYANINFNDVLDDEDGFANIAFGFKYAAYSEPETESLLTLGLRYEIPIEDLETSGIELQGNGDGFLNPFITGTRTFGKLGIQGSLGANIALDMDEDTSIVHYSLHADYEVAPGWFPMIELNGYTPIDDADRSTDALGDLDGVDLLNFGSEDRGTTIALGGGLRYKLNNNLQFGAGGEFPLTENEDSILGYRLYADLVLSLW